MNKNQQIADAFHICVADSSDRNLALLYKTITKRHIIRTQSDDIYIYNETNRLYEKSNKNIDLAAIIEDDLNVFLTKYIEKITKNVDKNNVLTVSREYRGLLNKVGSYQHIQQITSSFAMKLPQNEKFLSKLNADGDILNFNNGVFVHLPTGKAYLRDHRFIISKCLPYAYKKITPAINNLMVLLRNILKQICNNSEEDVVLLLKWLSTMMTGRQIKKILLIIGHSANNGKTSIFDLMSSSFPEMIDGLNANAFDANASGNDYSKTITSLSKCRGAFLDEAKNSKNSADAIKRVTNKVIPNNGLYDKSSTSLKMCAKVTYMSNYDLEMKEFDQGIMNRLMKIEVSSQFLKGAEFDVRKNEPLVFEQINLDEICQNKLLGISMFHLLLPHAMEFYRSGGILNGFEKWENSFKNVASDGDLMQNFIDQNFVVTGDAADRINKSEMREIYIDFMNKPCEWSYLRNQLLRFPKIMKYNDQQTHKYVKGVFSFIKRVSDKSSESDNIIEDKVKLPDTMSLGTRVAKTIPKTLKVFFSSEGLEKAT